ncbi:MAG: hypothetical protein QG574_4330 [Cyanobacteriota bacterium erpe_2018_sw_21hr_WHONDRS-SW48-000092_B_bin.40]|jgi:hypothetical protein|nr:hypothetical protein [Cyanobacteriota bacterium erpe_2018_sw_21hr_WHONDRS-SW48-000092_B_bin.40]
MSNFEAENFSAKCSDNTITKGGCGSDSIHNQLTTDDFRRLLPNKVKPDVCIRDQDGYIACGPIVGYERPDPILGKVVKPMEPIGKDPMWQKKIDLPEALKKN